MPGVSPATNFGRKDVIDNRNFGLETLSDGEKPEWLRWKRRLAKRMSLVYPTFEPFFK